MKKYILKALESLLHLDFMGLEGKKKYIGILLLLAHKYIPGFPEIDLTQELSLDQLFLIWGVISDLIKKFSSK